MEKTKFYLPIAFLMLVFNLSCQINKTNIQEHMQSDIKNEKLKNYKFLEEMYQDSYYPDSLVDKGKWILIELCLQIEETKPQNLKELYKLTHKSTDKFNALQEEFYKSNSEIETIARECIAADFDYISKSYGFKADIEELISTREW